MTLLSSNKSFSYIDAGVDIDLGNTIIDAIKPFAKSTFRKGIIGDIGGFGALFEISKKFKEPVLVSSTDGIGTKLKLASTLKCYDTIGIDLVAMNVNDILTQGAEPLFFLDYFACGKLNISNIINIIRNIAQGCRIAGCALIGGETAEMPGMYVKEEYDLAGFSVGVVEKNKLINGANIMPGDIILGLASSGIHSNGYSLVRKILEIVKPDFNIDFYGNTLAEALLEPTRIYVKSLLTLMKIVEIKGLIHITGGGLIKNIPRLLHKNLTAVLYRDAWIMPPLFNWLQLHGNITDQEMYRVFNCGIGMVVIISKNNVDIAIKQLEKSGESVICIGKIFERDTKNAQVMII